MYLLLLRLHLNSDIHFFLVYFKRYFYYLKYFHFLLHHQNNNKFNFSFYQFTFINYKLSEEFLDFYENNLNYNLKLENLKQEIELLENAKELSGTIESRYQEILKLTTKKWK